jgi:hypothetical protein
MARKYKRTENQLVEDWLLWRVSIDPLIPSFEGLFLESEMFKSILSSANADVLELLGWEFGRKHFAKNQALFDGAGETMTFVRYVVEVLGEHGGWFRVESDVDEGSLAMTLHHDLSSNWTIFLRSYLSAAYEVISQKKLTCQTKVLEQGSADIRLPLPRPSLTDMRQPG